MACDLGKRKRGKVSNPRRLTLFPEAIADLMRLREFINAHNPNAAARAAKRIREAIKKLPEQAFLGLPVADIDNPDLRDWFVAFGQGGYWVRYRVTGDEIQIIKIWHGRENPK